MVKWKPMLMGAGVGAAAGVADNVVQGYDEKRALEYSAANPGKTMSDWAQIGTWTNFLLPAAALVTVGLMGNKLSNENIVLVSAVSGQLAGRKAAHRWWKITGAPTSPAPMSHFVRANRPAPRTYDPEFNGTGIV